MKEPTCCKGFSLVEILVALFIVSFAAVNISALQKEVGDQSRDNTSHLIVIELAKESIHRLLRINDIQELYDLNGTRSSHTRKGKQYSLVCKITIIPGVPLDSPVANVAIEVTWDNSKGEAQYFVYSKLVSLTMSLKGISSEALYIINNLLDNNNVEHFKGKVDYPIGAYVIYNSQLFLANQKQTVNGGSQIPPINKAGMVMNGWENLGRIDNPELATLFTD